MKQPKKGRLWLNDGSRVRLRPEYRNHVWSYDFVHCRTLNILDEHSRECLAIKVKRKLNSGDVIDAVRRQSFWASWRPDLREGLAHLVGLIMRRICDGASAGFR